jgi:Domain of unknown function (DUF4440)
MSGLGRPLCCLQLALMPIAQIPAQAQVPDSGEELFNTIKSLDAGLFDAVNHCDIEKVRDYFAEDAVFLHDKAPPLVGRGAIAEHQEQPLRKGRPGTNPRHLGGASVEGPSILSRRTTGSWARGGSSTSGSLC